MMRHFTQDPLVRNHPQTNAQDLAQSLALSEALRNHGVIPRSYSLQRPDRRLRVYPLDKWRYQQSVNRRPNPSRNRRQYPTGGGDLDV